jgi:NCS1 family nucleobase:cation symporter-1
LHIFPKMSPPSRHDVDLDLKKQRGDSLPDNESTPLLAGTSTSLPQQIRRHSSRTIDRTLGTNTHGFVEQEISFHSSDENSFFDFMMETVKSTKLAHWVDKLAVESEPGLTNAQLMLNNHDLKPVEPERRLWGAW